MKSVTSVSTTPLPTVWGPEAQALVTKAVEANPQVVQARRAESKASGKWTACIGGALTCGAMAFSLGIATLDAVHKHLPGADTVGQITLGLALGAVLCIGGCIYYSEKSASANQVLSAARASAHVALEA